MQNAFISNVAQQINMEQSSPVHSAVRATMNLIENLTMKPTEHVTNALFQYLPKGAAKVRINNVETVACTDSGERPCILN